HRLQKVSPEIGQRIFDTRRDRRINAPRHIAVALEPAQRRGQHLLRDAADPPPERTEAHHPLAELHDDQHGPFVAHQRQDFADGPAVTGEMRVHWFHRGARVTWKCRIAGFRRSPIWTWSPSETKAEGPVRWIMREHPMAIPQIGIVIGTTREGRFADAPARWIAEAGAARGDLALEIVDLRDYPLPFFDEPTSPAYG